MDFSEQEAKFGSLVQKPKDEKKKRSTWLKFLPTALGVGATLAAAPLTGGASLAGTAAILGGSAALGAGLGEFGAQKFNQEKTNLGAIGKEALISGATGAIPIGGAAKGARVAAKVAAEETAAKTLLKEGGEKALAEGAEQVVKTGAKKGESGLLSKVVRAGEDNINRASGLKTGAKLNGKTLGASDVDDIAGFLQKEVGATGGKPIDKLRQVEQFQKGKIGELDKVLTSKNVKVTPEEIGSITGSIKKPTGVNLADNATHNELLQDFAKVKDVKGVDKFRREVDDLINFNRNSATPDPLTDKIAKSWRESLDGFVTGKVPEAKTLKTSLSKSYNAQELLAKQAGKAPKDAAIFGTEIPGTGALKESLTNNITQKGTGLLSKVAGAGVPQVGITPVNVAKETAKQAIGKTVFGSALPQDEAAIAGDEESILSQLEQGDTPDIGAEQESQFDQNKINEGLQQAALKALASGDTKGLENITKVAALIQGMQETKGGKELNATAAGNVTDLENGIINIGELSDQFGASDANNPVIGAVRGLNPLDTDAQGLQANIARVKQVIGKALEGGVLRKEDEVKYGKILPKLTDTDDVAARKISAIQSDLARKLSLYKKNLGGGGGGTVIAAGDTL